MSYHRWTDSGSMAEMRGAFSLNFSHTHFFYLKIQDSYRGTVLQLSHHHWQTFIRERTRGWVCSEN